MIKQRTIKEPVTIEGIGLQTGNKVTLNLKSSPANSGINFIRSDLPNKPLLNIQSIDLRDSAPQGIERRTTLGFGALQVQTIEHLMAALWGLSIDNIVIELDNVELPGLDGSAKTFLDILKKAGIIEQDAPKKNLRIDEAIWCKGDDSLIAIFPNDDFKVSYTLSYKDTGIGTQFFSLTLDEKSFEREISPARTFCLEEDALKLLKQGFGKGANYDNTLVMGHSGVIKNVLRFPDEPVRHKILDIVGDLYILGASINGHVVAIKSGHKLNMELVGKLKEKLQKR